MARLSAAPPRTQPATFELTRIFSQEGPRISPEPAHRIHAEPFSVVFHLAFGPVLIADHVNNIAYRAVVKVARIVRITRAARS